MSPEKEICGGVTVENTAVSRVQACQVVPVGLMLAVHDEGGVRHIPLPHGKNLIVGRDPSADICIAHLSVSRCHARIQVGSRLTVEDLNSLNGTWIHGERQTAHLPISIGPGTLFGIGNVQATVELSPTALAEEAPNGIIVRSAAMRALLSRLTVVSKGTCPILLLGETGVGKEVLASIIHAFSNRTKGPFVRLNCAALPAEMVESELFGHERGAFTSAVSSKPGLLEAADGGTILLDEIGDLPLPTQAKLLRAIETMEVTRLGAVKPKKLDFRLISATNHDLFHLSQTGRFRPDLYYRICGMEVFIPPLRERTDDIVPLAEHFLKVACRSAGTAQKAFTEGARTLLLGHSWPGNVRELKNAVERAALLATSTWVDRNNISFAGGRAATEAPQTAPLGISFRRATTEAEQEDFYHRRRREEKDAIWRALAAHNGNQTKAAEHLGMPRRTLTKRLTEYGIRVPRKVGRRASGS